jgi:hypothetical protein
MHDPANNNCPQNADPRNESCACGSTPVTTLPGGVTFTGGTEAMHNILRGRGAFVSQYCQNKGWDLNNLTFDQLLEIRAQPGWKEPVNDLGNTPAAQEQMDALCEQHDGFGIRDEDAMAQDEEDADIHEGQPPYDEDAPVTVDLTPRGCTTPEGRARVLVAQQAFDDSAAALANAAMEFFDNHGNLVMEAIRGVEDAALRKELRKQFSGVTALMTARLRAQEAFLRAVAGAPPMEITK